MSSLRGQCRKSKRASANPYAGRGLDKFALVSAELEAKREELAEQLDTPLSMVKFAIGSHNKWIPIILSRSTKKGSHGLKKKSGGNLASVDKSTQKGALHNDGKASAAGTIAQLGSEYNRIDKGLGVEINENRANLGSNFSMQSTQFSGLGDEISGPTDGFINEEKGNLAPLGLLGIQSNNLGGEIIEIFPAPSELEHIAALYKAEGANGLQGHNAKGAAWIVSKVFFQWRRKSIRKNTAAAESSPLRGEKEVVDEAPCASHTSVVPSSHSSLEKTPAASPVQAHLLPLPSPPARVKTPTSKQSTTDQAEIAETMDESSTLSKGKRPRKCKGKSLLKVCSAPSTPRDSRQPQKPFTAASVPPKAFGSNDQAAHRDVKEERSIVRQVTSPEQVLLTSRLSRASMAEKAKKERASRVGQALVATGLILSLSGLIMGYVSAVLGVVCWWYMLPRLRKAVGDKPVVRSHHNTAHGSGNNTAKRSNVQQLKSDKAGIQEAGSGKYDLQSLEYKKKVIMEGFLDRGRRSSS